MLDLHRSIMVQQPWATAIARGQFPCLVKRAPIRLREWIGILATKKADPLAGEGDGTAPAAGCLVGAVRVVDCLEVESDATLELERLYGRAIADAYPRHFLPNGAPAHIWVFAESVALDEPIRWHAPVGKVWSTTRVSVHGELQFLRPPLASGHDEPRKTPPGRPKVPPT